jgi:hypothetical protein
MKDFSPLVTTLVEYTTYRAVFELDTLVIYSFCHASESHRHSLVEGTTPKADNIREQGERILEPKTLSGSTLVSSSIKRVVVRLTSNIPLLS